MRMSGYRGPHLFSSRVDPSMSLKSIVSRLDEVLIRTSSILRPRGAMGFRGEPTGRWSRMTTQDALVRSGRSLRSGGRSRRADLQLGDRGDLPDPEEADDCSR